MTDEWTEVPVLRSFDQSEPIGFLRIKTSELPLTADFCFALGVMAHGFVGEPCKSAATPYTLASVSLVNDQSYARYLQQIGVFPAEGSEP